MSSQCEHKKETHDQSVTEIYKIITKRVQSDIVNIIKRIILLVKRHYVAFFNIKFLSYILCSIVYN